MGIKETGRWSWSNTPNCPKVTCPCGGTWYDSQHNPIGTVGLTRRRCEPGVAVVCIRCGRVGRRSRTMIDAIGFWEAGHIKYGPLEDDKQ